MFYPSRSGRPARPNRLRHARLARSDTRQRPDRAETLTRALQEQTERDDAPHLPQSVPVDRQGGHLADKGPAQTGRSRQICRRERTEREPLTKRADPSPSGLQRVHFWAPSHRAQVQRAITRPPGQAAGVKASPTSHSPLSHQTGRMDVAERASSSQKTDLTRG